MRSADTAVVVAIVGSGFVPAPQGSLVDPQDRSATCFCLLRPGPAGPTLSPAPSPAAAPALVAEATLSRGDPRVPARGARAQEGGLASPMPCPCLRRAPHSTWHPALRPGGLRTV